MFSTSARTIGEGQWGVKNGGWRPGQFVPLAKVIKMNRAIGTTVHILKISFNTRQRTTEQGNANPSIPTLYQARIAPSGMAHSRSSSLAGEIPL